MWTTILLSVAAVGAGALAWKKRAAIIALFKPARNGGGGDTP